MQTVAALSRILDHGGETPVPGDAADGHSNSSWPAAVAGTVANVLEPMHCSAVGCWILGCPGTLFHDVVCLPLSQSHLRMWQDVATTKSVAK